MFHRDNPLHHSIVNIPTNKYFGCFYKIIFVTVKDGIYFEEQHVLIFVNKLNKYGKPRDVQS